MVTPLATGLKMMLEYAISINIAVFTITTIGQSLYPEGGSLDAC
jgi:hypothetical protein